MVCLVLLYFYFLFLFFFFNDTATTEIYTLSLYDALPISRRDGRRAPERHRFRASVVPGRPPPFPTRSRPRWPPRRARLQALAAAAPPRGWPGSRSCPSGLPETGSVETAGR